MKIAIFENNIDKIEYLYNLYGQYNRDSFEWFYGFSELCNMIESGEIVKVMA